MVDRVNSPNPVHRVGRKSAAPSAGCGPLIRRKALRFSALQGMFLALTLSSTAHADITDPTRPPPGYAELELSGAAAPAQPEAALVVSSLFLMGAKPYAVVDGQIVRPGDPLAGGKVGRIDANGVWISVPAGGAVPARGKTRTGMRLLKWLPEVVKTPAQARPAARTEKK